MSSQFKTHGYFSPGGLGHENKIHSPRQAAIMNQAMQYPIVVPRSTSSFWDKRAADPAARIQYAEKVYRTVIDLQSGQPREQYLTIFQGLLITPEQVRDL